MPDEAHSDLVATVQSYFLQDWSSISGSPWFHGSFGLRLLASSVFLLAWSVQRHRQPFPFIYLWMNAFSAHNILYNPCPDPMPFGRPTLPARCHRGEEILYIT